MKKKNLKMIFPTEIISDILTRLPTESVLECKLVCKTWKNLIHHPSFPQMHLARLNHNPDSGKLSYVILDSDDDDNQHLFYFEYGDNEDWNYVKPIRRNIVLETTCDACILIGSFNGLICIYGSQPDLPDTYGPAIVFNPVTKEYIILPEFERFPEFETESYSHLGCGFGYVAETKEYKVVRIYMVVGKPNFVEVEVYTVGSGKGWRHVGKFGFEFCTHAEHTHGVFLNGALYWRNTEGGKVVVFDLVDEKFCEHISPPPMLTDTDDDEDNDGFIVIGVSGGGVLFYVVCQSIEESTFDDVWLFMKKNDNCVINEQQGHQSWGWIKVDSLEQREPFAFMEGGSVLRYEQGNCKIFHSRTSTWETIVNFGAISDQVFPHKHTLVSLKELGEEDAKIMKPRGIEEIDSGESDSD